MEWVEYEHMHAVEDRMWWYRGLRALAASLLERMTDDGFRAWSRRITIGVSLTYLTRGVWLVVVP